MGRPKKEARLTIKIDPDLLKFFKQWCKENQDTMSGYVKRHILAVKREYEAQHPYRTRSETVASVQD
jgi:hypothetical protein